MDDMSYNIKGESNKDYHLKCFMHLVTQSCLTLCDPMDYSPPGSSGHGILQARILEWAAKPSSLPCRLLLSLHYFM